MNKIINRPFARWQHEFDNPSKSCEVVTGKGRKVAIKTLKTTAKPITPKVKKEVLGDLSPNEYEVDYTSSHPKSYMRFLIRHAPRAFRNQDMMR